MSPASQLLINIADSAKTGVVASIYSTNPGGVPTFIDSSGENFAISALIPTTNPASGRYYDFSSLESARTSGTLILALGDTELPPTSGSFLLSYDGDSTGLTALAYNITAAALQTALNANSGFNSGGKSCTVVKIGIDYQVTMDQVGARDLLSPGTGNSLLPTSSVFISRKITGDGSTHDVQVIRLVQKPAAMQDTWDALPSVPSSGVTLTEGASSYLWTMAMPSGAYSGSASVVVTINSVAATFSTSWNDTAATVQASLQALANVGAGKATVTGGQGGPFAITFDPSLTSGITMVGTNLNIQAPIGIKGWLNPNTDVMAEKFDAAGNPESIPLKLAFQIQDVDDLFPRTVLQVNATVYQSVINTATLAPSPSLSYYTATQCDGRFIQIADALTVGDPHVPNKPYRSGDFIAISNG